MVIYRGRKGGFYMKNTLRIHEEISKNVVAKKHMHTKLTYFCESQEDVKALTDNITRVLTRHLGDTTLAKITYEYYPSENKVEVEVIEH